VVDADRQENERRPDHCATEAEARLQDPGAGQEEPPAHDEDEAMTRRLPHQVSGVRQSPSAVYSPTGTQICPEGQRRVEPIAAEHRS
jgi:hypothetical protein